MIDDTDDDLGAQTVSRRECEHGSLARKCLICELQAENAELRTCIEENASKDAAVIHSQIMQKEELQRELSTLRESMRWLPMETAPSERAVDIWIKSTKNEEYGIRSCNVWMVGDEWHGGRVPLEKYGEYAAHWMPLPKPPEDSSDE